MPSSITEPLINTINTSEEAVYSQQPSSSSNQTDANDISEFTQKAYFPQVTLRATTISLFIGTLVLLSNMQFGLQSGWITMMTLPSSLLSCAIFKSIYPIFFPYNGNNFTDVENVYCQSIAVAVGTSALSLGFVGIVPAIQKFLTIEEAGGLDLSILSYKQLLYWGTGLAFFGVFFAVPLRSQVVIKEKLPFPSGQSTAVLISVLNGNTPIIQEVSQHEINMMKLKLDNNEDSNQSILTKEDSTKSNSVKQENSDYLYKQNIKILLITFIISAFYTIFSYFIPQVKAIPIFGKFLSTHYMWNFQPSPAYFGQGIIMGHKTTSYMLLGALLGWGFLSYIAYYKKYVDINVDPNDWQGGISGWVLWPSLTIMLVDSLIGLMIVCIKACAKFYLQSKSKIGFNNENFKFNKKTFRASFFGTKSRDDFPELPLPMPINNLTDRNIVMSTNMNKKSSILGTMRRSSSPTNNSQYGSSDNLDEIAIVDENAETKILKVKENGHTIIYVSNEHINDDIIDENLLVSNTITITGIVVSFMLCILGMIYVFGIHIIPVSSLLLALFLSMFLSILAVRALGETDLNPVSGLGKLSQLIFSLITKKNTPGAILINLVAGAISEAGSEQAGDLMQDLKTGHLLGASPKSQFIGMLIGTTYSIPVAAALYLLYDKVYEIPSLEFRIPTALVWINSARLFYGGGLPEGCVFCCLIVGVIFSIISLIKNLMIELGKGKQHKWLVDILPSGVAVGISMIILPAFTIQRFLGGMFAFWYYNREGSSRTKLIIVSSGLILGEGVCSVLNMIFASCKVPHM
ncbi:hypothetical protein DAHU10_035770 [Hanseniaspora uvarum]|nr:hypothetical protein DAHU10_035770 [Hanseniaspora uvarum]